jgi:hypothetical protein
MEVHPKEYKIRLSFLGRTTALLIYRQLCIARTAGRLGRDMGDSFSLQEPARGLSTSWRRWK